MSTRTLDRETPVIALPAKPRSIWRQRRFHVALLVLGAIVISAVATNALLTSRFTPAAAVSDYLQAIKDGDAAAAMKQVQAVSTTPSDLRLTDAAAMRAALANSRPDIKSFAVNSTTYLDSAQTNALVGVSYDTASGTKQTSFAATRAAQNQYGLYPTWRIDLPATILKITALGPVSIDGKEIALPAGGSASVAVLPVAHRVVFGGSAMLQRQVTSIDGFGVSAASITYKPTLTPDGLSHAKAAIANAFAACVQHTAAGPRGCPQHVDHTYSGQWSLVGDPTTDLQISADDKGQLVGRGHFQMVFAYQHTGWSGVSHDISAGGYAAALTVSTSDIAVGALAQDASVPTLQRPDAATDQAALSLVSAAMATCAKSTSEFQADCPQGLFSSFAEDIRWHINGDPTKGATVTFDPNTGILDVHGPLDMTASYSNGGFPESDSSDTISYDALLLWDGQQLQLITIGGNFYQ